jgi:hypothetical protein
MVKMLKIIFLFLFVGTVITSCNNSGSAQYEQAVKRELASGKRVDTVFFGLYFGMTSKQFFTYCWQMSKQGVFTDGVNNQYVLYKLNNNELKHPASMNFYPDFQNDKIFRMRVLYQYDAWAPWNKQQYSDSLLQDVVHLYEKQYQKTNPFITITDKKRGTIYVKVDGNRRITIGRYNDAVVKADITDLVVERQINDSSAVKK